MSAVDHKPGESVLLRRDDAGITTLTLNRPRQYNALSEALLVKMQAVLDDIAADRSIRVVVLAGSGPAFCSGHDLKELRAHRQQQYYENLFRQCSRMMLSIIRLPQPVVARVHGSATAAGCQLAATCDLAVAATSARFAVSGVNLGLFCSTPGVALSRNIARKQAFEMLVTGNFIDANTAVRYGLINRAVDASQLDEAVADLTRAIVAKSAVVIETGKRMFYRQLERDMEGAYEYASDVMACNLMTADASEGIDAFLDKRQPRWKGR